MRKAGDAGREQVGERHFAPLDLAPAEVDAQKTPEGGYLLRSPRALEPHEESLGAMFRRWVAESPDRIFLGERDASGEWRLVTWGEAGRLADSVAQALIDRRMGSEQPVMILSGNSVDHALLMLGGFIAGVPVVPVSVAYSLLSQDFSKLKSIFREVAPALVFAESAEMFSRALSALDLAGVEVVASRGTVEGVPVTPFASFLETVPTEAVSKAFAAVRPGSVAKVLFTSGSTGLPKGVINTHRMLCSNQQMLAQIWPFTKATPPVLVDWLPWNHTFGGNHNFNLVLKRGGTLYVDGGKPAPGLVEQTVRNLAEISPTVYFNVPAGFAMILPFLERDASVRDSFFRRLQLIFYAGAALSQDLWRRLEAVSLEATGRVVPMTSSWGSTETAPLATSAHFPIDRAGVIGIPCPGVTIKMVPSGGKYELRVKGPNVTPGYLHRPDLTRNAFDAEGFYRIGDAGTFADPDDPARGIVFAGRVAEDFKLSTHVGNVRLAVMAAAAPALQDALVTGHDREAIGILAWPNLLWLREVCRDTGGSRPLAELVVEEEVLRHLRDTLAEYNGRQQGSATRIGRVLLMTEPPSIDANEITDKGYINQGAALERRGELVERLYADRPDPGVVVL
ncbi:MAG: feruloyl-CoA synthase [Deltaproteobacteria bacterium]|nr:feruloyl-CoA synthase [Deltaproteobacteria bacterium]